MMSIQYGDGVFDALRIEATEPEEVEEEKYPPLEEVCGSKPYPTLEEWYNKEG